MGSGSQDDVWGLDEWVVDPVMKYRVGRYG